MAQILPRPATTVVLIRDGHDGLEVLMVVRRHGLSQYSAAMVFPGGLIEPSDGDDEWLPLCEGHAELDPTERARRVAGFRELYEETGLLLLAGQVTATNISDRKRSFREVVQVADGRLDLSKMVPFAHWITPEGPPKRYDTFFRLCWLPAGSSAVADGVETVGAEWLKPADAIALGQSGKRNVLIPTRCQLYLLERARTVEQAAASALGRTIVTVTPTLQERDDGMYVSIPAEAGYPVCNFQVHAQ